MTLVIPSVPDIPAGAIVDADDLNDIGAAVTFLLNKPIALVYDSAGGQAVGTSYPPTTDVSFASKYFDTDGMWSSSAPTKLTVNTPGFYKVWHQISSQSAGTAISGMIYCTTGVNNPLGSGTVFGPYWGATSNAGTTVGTPTSSSGIFPLYMYAGDWFHVRAYAASGTMTTYAAQPSRMGAEWISA